MPRIVKSSKCFESGFTRLLISSSVLVVESWIFKDKSTLSPWHDLNLVRLFCSFYSASTCV